MALTSVVGPGSPSLLLCAHYAATLAEVLNARAVHHRTLHTLQPHATVDDALRLFSAQRVKAAPIVDDSRAGRARYLGILSLFDLLIPITSDATLRTLNILPAEQRAAYLSTHPPAVYATSVQQYLGMASESGYLYHYAAQQPLADVMEVLSHGVHRVLVFDKDGLVRGGGGGEESAFTLTQMDVVRFLTQHSGALGAVTGRSLLELGLANEDASFEHFHKGHGSERNIDHAYEDIPTTSSTASSAPAPTPPPPPPPVQRRPSVTEQLRFLLPSSTALSGFAAMHPPSTAASASPSADVTALPIVDPHNFALQSTLSASDLRSITSDRAALLGLPVLDFLRELWLMGAAASSGKAKDSAEVQRVPYIFQVVAKGESPLGQVMKEMVEDEVHRSWLVDELGRVVGVVTLTDVLAKLSPFDRERERTARSASEEEKLSERKGR